ncbi:nucleotidyl transferase AbiEii/AbiGii toxin family protein [Patescibacteria group bacterium]|nr:nucleotidyl transferase AbiEii/AbiGii toxin family protein [Patescibacteria group bacterium]
MTENNLQILDKKRLEIFKNLNSFKKEGYLAGGTALALQLNHRFSYDFDFFCYRSINRALLNKIRKNFLIKKIAINNNDEFTFFNKDNIKITFLYFPFEFKNKLVNVKQGPQLLSVLDIASAKAYALNRRGSWRDYLDLYNILKSEKNTLKQIIDNAEKIFQEMFSKKLFLSQLTYFDDVDKSDIKKVNFFKNPVDLGNMKNFFESEIKKQALKFYKK